MTQHRKFPMVEVEAAQGWEDGLWLDPKWSEQLRMLASEAATPQDIDPKWMALVAVKCSNTDTNTT